MGITRAIVTYKTATGTVYINTVDMAQFFLSRLAVATSAPAVNADGSSDENLSWQASSLVAVPDNVREDIPAVAASMSAKKIVEEAVGRPLHNPGLAYAEARQRISRRTANRFRETNREANERKHGKDRGRQHTQMLQDLSSELAASSASSTC